MATLLFAEPDTLVPWRGHQGQLFARRCPVRQYISDGHWQPPTADSVEFRMVRVVRGERTCLACGETFPAGGFCARCGLTEIGARAGAEPAIDKLPPNIPTESYLKPEEYRIIT